MRPFLYLFIAVILSVGGYTSYKNTNYSYKNAHLRNSSVMISDKMTVAFTPEGIDDVVLISMVKNEEDIIFENLIWHFTIGFRKFIIVDNNSDDNTRKLIKKFAELTKDKAKVFIVDDPIFEHIQSRIMTGVYDFAKSVWPDISWVFPVDADEFWIPEAPLKTILHSVPDDVDAITTLCVQHRPVIDSYEISPDLPFYDRIPHRFKVAEKQLGKIAFRAIKNREIIIAHGNHGIDTKTHYPSILKKRLKLLGNINYESGNTLGLHMTEFSLRSIEHAHKKLSNGAKVNMAAKELGILSPVHGANWNSYTAEMDKFGEGAAKLRFEGTFIQKHQAVHDPLHMKESFDLFYKIIAK